jgi:hypothetical protein
MPLILDVAALQEGQLLPKFSRDFLAWLITNIGKPPPIERHGIVSVG